LTAAESSLNRQRPSHDAIPFHERQATKWASALATIAAEIQGKDRKTGVETALRALGGRLALERLGPIGDPPDTLPLAIDRALEALDWGWVAAVERDGGVFLEHRAPPPFDDHADLLVFLLEGFYRTALGGSDVNSPQQVRLVGRADGTMIFSCGAGAKRLIPAAAPLKHPNSATEIFASLTALKSESGATPVAKRLPVASQEKIPEAAPPLSAGKEPDVPVASPAPWRFYVIAGVFFVLLIALGLWTSRGMNLPH
jgi:hypothetical protein